MSIKLSSHVVLCMLLAIGGCTSSSGKDFFTETVESLHVRLGTHSCDRVTLQPRNRRPEGLTAVSIAGNRQAWRDTLDRAALGAWIRPAI